MHSTRIAIRIYGRQCTLSRYSSSNSENRQPSPPPDHSVSAKLWADAAREEAEDAAEAARQRRRPSPVAQHENWTGDEPLQDAVLRMLVDKYKPLRGGTIRTAEEKLRQAPPAVTVSSSAPGPALAHGAASAARAAEPLIPPVEGHKPWLVTFTAPSHAVNVKLGNMSSTPASASTPTPASILSLDERERRKAREAKKRGEKAERLTRARESTLDYKIGLKQGAFQRPNPISLKGWGGLIEEKIERARSEGQFRSIKGRGRPLVRQTDEGNPFIAREEFLMNRIVQRNGAAPPWVEFQTELDAAVTSFREVLRQSWTRRAVRILTTSNPLPLLAHLTLADAISLRDAAWEARERAYHEAAVDEVNALVRKYNGVAPYAVRRPYHARDAELGRAYRESGEDILSEIATRLREAGLGTGRAVGGQPGDDDERGGGGGNGVTYGSVSNDDRRVRLWDVIRGWLAKTVP